MAPQAHRRTYASTLGLITLDDIVALAEMRDGIVNSLSFNTASCSTFEHRAQDLTASHISSTRATPSLWSSRNQGYETTDSRRSPRDRSPGRYNDSRDADQYRGGAFRGGSERRRSIPDVRTNHNAFGSNRELFREPTGRDSSREFPSREPPRGPKGLIDAPTGPRASNYGSDFRGDSGFRGDFRGRGRGRGRGWRDDSRDRGRDTDRDYRDRDRREERGPAPFRDDRSRDRDRDRWDRDNFRGRRPSSPQGRGRSPTYAARETRDSRDGPILDLDRTHRGSRDGPSSVGSPTTESLTPFVRGYGRARGSRGRGRGAYYEDYHRPPPVRSRSPEGNWNRRTQPSATPPPQVPAFGSASANASTSTASLPPSVPTAPRSHTSKPRQIIGRGTNKAVSLTWVRPTDHSHPRGDLVRDDESNQPHNTARENLSSHDGGSLQESISPKEDISHTLKSPSRAGVTELQTDAHSTEHARHPKKRRPRLVRHYPKVTSPLSEDSDVSSDSADDFDDNYFDDEIAKVKEQIAEVKNNNPLLLPPEPILARDLRPFAEPIISSIPTEVCEVPIVQKEHLAEPSTEATAATQALDPATKVQRRPRTPTPVAEPPVSSKINGDITAPVPDAALPIPDQSDDRRSNPPQDVSSTFPMPTDHDTNMPDQPVQPPHDRDADIHRHAKELASNQSNDIHIGSINPPTGQGIDFQDKSSRSPTIQQTSTHNETKAAPDDAGATNGDITLKAQPEQASEPVNAAPEPMMIPVEPVANGKIGKSVSMMEQFTESYDKLNEQEREDQLEAVRKMMKTPPISELPKSTCGSFWNDPTFKASLEVRSLKSETAVRKHIQKTKARRQLEQKQEGIAWADRYYQYRKFTDFSMDPAAVRSREKFAASRARAAAEAATPALSSVASASAKPEGRRTASRWATDHDIERVLRESEQEARQKKEQDERLARAKTASAKEATIPAMMDDQWWSENAFADKSHLVPFERSFAILEHGEPIDNFTEEEGETFEKAYLENPKNWSKIAEALPKRNFKACIQHYYLVKHPARLKERVKERNKKKRGRGPGKARPKVLTASLGNGDDEEAQENETGESKRRPRRAAAPVFPIDATPSESEVASPAPTPGRKAAATPKADAGNDAGPAKKKVKVAREKGKQAKNNPLLAAAPIAAAARRDESPATPAPIETTKNQRTPIPPSRFPPQFDGPGPSQPHQATFAPPFAPLDRPNLAMTGTFDIIPQPPQHSQPQSRPQSQPQPQSYPSQERVESNTPLNFETQQNHRNIQQTSSYWSVPEQNDFPALLRHFGTDWHGIAKWMTSKTHIMVYTHLFQRWLVMPSDKNRSRCAANIQTQVKNYYQRQVDSGRMREWEEIARDADEMRERGEPTAPLPVPTVIPKRRYDAPSSSLPSRSGSAIDGIEDISSPGQGAVLARSSHGSPQSQPTMGTRFPPLTNAGAGTVPVSHIQPAVAASIINKQVPPQSSSQGQQSQQQSRARGPPLGYFNIESSPRPILQATQSDSVISQRSLQVAHEAQLERQSALRLEKEQREQREQQQQREQRDQQQQREQREREKRELLQRELQQRELHQRELQQREQQQREQQQREQQQREQHQQAAAMQQQAALQRERHFKMKQEPEGSNLHQYEPYSTAPVHPTVVSHSRPEVSQPSSPLEGRRQPPLQQFHPRTHQAPRTLLSEKPTVQRDIREMKPSPSPAAPRPPLSAPPIAKEQYSAPPQPKLPVQPQVPPPSQPPQPPQVASVRQQEAVRKTSNISMLLNDEPNDPRPEPPQRVSSVASNPQQSSRTPPPQHPLQANRFAAHPSQPTSQPAQQMPQQISAQQTPQQHLSQTQNPYAQSSPHPVHQHTASLGHARSYTPTGFEHRNYGATSAAQQPPQQPQQMYSQPPPRQSAHSQPNIRREPSISDVHGLATGYARGGTSQSTMRLKESPYSSTTPPASAQPVRQQVASPLDHAPPVERDFYTRQPQAQYLMQQQPVASSPQLGPSYHSQPQQQQASHRQLAFGQSPSHMASPPSHFATQHQVHRSRHNSLDGRFPGPGSSGPTPSHPAYSQPAHQTSHPSMQYQPPHPSQERSERDYAREMRERILQDEAATMAAYHRRESRR
ncbi:uncharacterized protein BP5553_08318 [Venustampulla echinocandica]|uniref:Uncharacterized protein n=1 Tax=Venustampulla echinocandica TaxID=2656787 RepID=A0A370TGD2_9HELO|nr:uncharacterized protein BP5553_08318 [Venustampulla echinocandica]RDL33950.1 hypothetical protein BP5553_08318 [Venustampulla echinocandica]